MGKSKNKSAKTAPKSPKLRHYLRREAEKKTKHKRPHTRWFDCVSDYMKGQNRG